MSYLATEFAASIINQFFSLHYCAMTAWATQKANSDERIPYIIVSSQYDSSIIEKAMQAGASGYITKPIAKETLWSTVELAVMKLHDAIINEKYIDVKVSQAIQRIQTKDILFIKSDHVYVEIVHTGGKLTCRYTLREMLEKINLPNFIQCHRSYIINRNKIQKYSSWKPMF